MNLTFQIGNYTPTNADVLKIINDPQGPITPHLHHIGRVITIAAKSQVGEDTGGLKNSIYYQIQKWSGGLPEVWIGTYHPIAYIHHEGTRPHAISARGAKFLRFSARGRMVYDRTVMHPGTKPNRFLSDNLYLARL